MMELQSLIFDEEPEIKKWKVPQPQDLPLLNGVKRVSLDTEDSGKNPFEDYVAGISLSWRDPDSNKIKDIYAPVRHSEGNMDPEIVKSWLEYVLEDKEVVFCHAKYDIQILRHGFGLDLEKLGVKPNDVQFPDALMDDNRRAGRSLEALSQRYLGRGKVQHDMDMNRLHCYPSWMVAKYAMGDSRNTLEIDERCEKPIREQNLESCLELENSIIYPVCEMETNGCILNLPLLQLWREEVKNTVNNVLIDLYQRTGLMIQPGSGESVARLFQVLGIDPPIRIPKKKQGQTKAAFEKELKEIEEGIKQDNKSKYPPYEIEELQSLKHPIIDLLVDARQLESLLSKFLDKYAQGLKGDVIRAQYHQLKGDEGGTVRGRFSSSGGQDLKTGYGFNAQQVIQPKTQIAAGQERWIVRQLFVPKEGYEYWSADASQIEYRLAAHFANAKKIIKEYVQNPDADFHDFIQKHIQRYKPSHNNRTVTKNTNFAYVFGAGIDQLAATAGITQGEAEELIRICKQIFPEAPGLLKSLAQQAKEVGFVSTIKGRRARFGPKDRHYAALNAVIQGSAADIFKMKLKAIYDEKKTLGIKALRQPVHDEFNGDKVPGEKYTKRMREFFNEQVIKLRIPIIWNLKTGKNWRECH